MRAVVAYAAKDLRIEEVATPEVGPHEVLRGLGSGTSAAPISIDSITVVLVPCACASR